MGVLVSCAAWCSLKAHPHPPERMNCTVEYRWKYIQLLLGRSHLPTGTDQEDFFNFLKEEIVIFTSK